MPGIHLNHHVSWDDLFELCYVYEDPGITLPVCECGRIAADIKKVQHQIKNRQYFADKPCTAANCKMIGEKLYRKTEKRKLIILCKNRNEPKLARFTKNFSTAIKEFAETERKKIKERNVFEPKEDVEQYCDDIEKKLRADGSWPTNDEKWNRYFCRCCTSDGSCKLFSVLLEAGDCQTLLSMPNEKIKKVLQCCHGQAIGWNLMFLADNIMQDTPNAWGPLKSDAYYRRTLMNDCDGQTFLYGCRKYLTDEVYMKDFDAIKELCKKCFQFLFTLEMLGKEVGDEFTISDGWLTVLKMFV
uniref:Uncharacterized protein n=1 Tax=Panagrolaimus sp. ES5 TaxID=591445 RepID=A0AC34FMB5_9BILA